MLRILASFRTLAAMVSPPVSSLSVARNHRPLRSATRPWRLPALKMSCKCQAAKDSLCVAACLRVVRACISVRIPFCLANTLGSCLWKFRGLHNLINKRLVFTTVLLDHTGEKPLVLFSEDSLTVLVFTVYILTDSDATESMVSAASAKGMCICSCKRGTLTQQSTKYPPRLVAFIARRLVDAWLISDWSY